VDSASLPVTVPLRQAGGSHFVDVALGDGPPVSLLVDTGSPTMVSSALAQHAGAVAVGTIETRSPDGRRATHPVVSIPNLRLGPARFSSVEAIVPPPQSLPRWIGAGVLGVNVMAAAFWQFDFPAGTLTIGSSVEGLSHVRGSLRLPFRPHAPGSPSPVVDLGIGDVHVPFLVDTGFAGGLAVHPADVPGADLTPPPGRQTDRPVVPVVVELALDDERPRPHTLETSDRLTSGLGLMGMDFLSDRVLTIDWASRTLYLAPGQRAPP
jgi:hypothetical protein